MSEQETKIQLIPKTNNHEKAHNDGNPDIEWRRINIQLIARIAGIICLTEKINHEKAQQHSNIKHQRRRMAQLRATGQSIFRLSYNHPKAKHMKKLTAIETGTVIAGGPGLVLQ